MPAEIPALGRIEPKIRPALWKGEESKILLIDDWTISQVNLVSLVAAINDGEEVFITGAKRSWNSKP